MIFISWLHNWRGLLPVECRFFDVCRLSQVDKIRRCFIFHELDGVENLRISLHWYLSDSDRGHRRIHSHWTLSSGDAKKCIEYLFLATTTNAKAIAKGMNTETSVKRQRQWPIQVNGDASMTLENLPSSFHSQRRPFNPIWRCCLTLGVFVA